MERKIWCPECRGTGIFTEGLSNHCSACNGKGYIEKDLVELDPDQKLPVNLYHKSWKFEDNSRANMRLESARIAFNEALEAMRRAGWRKVKLES